MAVDDDEIQSYLLAEARVKLWLEEVNEYELPDFWPDLQDGIALCQLMEQILPRSIPQIHDDWENGITDDQKRENIQFFLGACEDGFGIKTFELDDLFSLKNRPKVIRTVLELGEAVQTMTDWMGAILRLEDDEVLWETVPTNISLNHKLELQQMLSAASFRRVMSVKNMREQAQMAMYTEEFSLELSNEEIKRISPAITRLQAHVRGRIARKRFQKMKRNEAHRNQIAHEILETERVYLQNLMILEHAFLVPLAQKCDKYVKALPTMLSTLKLILNVSKTMTKELTPIIQDWGPKQRIGKIFLNLVHYLKVYTKYINDYTPCHDNIIAARKESGFMKVLAELENEPSIFQRGLPFESYLILPVQRIPRYELLLREMVRYTDESHPDYADLSSAQGEISTVGAYVNEKKKVFESQAQVIEVSQKFGGQLSGLIQSHRRLVREGTFFVYPKKNKKKVTLFLFNDLLIVGTPEKKRKETSYKLQAQVPLKHAAVRGINNSDSRIFGFQVTQRKDGVEEDVVNVLSESEDEKKSWMQDINELQKEENMEKGVRKAEETVAAVEDVAEAQKARKRMRRAGGEGSTIKEKRKGRLTKDGTTNSSLQDVLNQAEEAHTLIQHLEATLDALGPDVTEDDPARESILKRLHQQQILYTTATMRAKAQHGLDEEKVRSMSISGDPPSFAVIPLTGSRPQRDSSTENINVDEGSPIRRSASLHSQLKDSGPSSAPSSSLTSSGSTPDRKKLFASQAKKSPKKGKRRPVSSYGMSTDILKELKLHQREEGKSPDASRNASPNPKGKGMSRLSSYISGKKKSAGSTGLEAGQGST